MNRAGKALDPANLVRRRCRSVRWPLTTTPPVTPMPTSRASRRCRPLPARSPAAPPTLVGTSSRAADPGGDLDPVEGEVALASADSTDEELVVPLVPRQFDEFICTSCYLVHHNSRLADPQRRICTDCPP